MANEIIEGTNAGGEPFKVVRFLTPRQAIQRLAPTTPEFPDRPMSEHEFMAITLRDHPEQSWLADEENDDWPRDWPLGAW